MVDGDKLKKVKIVDPDALKKPFSVFPLLEKDEEGVLLLMQRVFAEMRKNMEEESKKTLKEKRWNKLRLKLCQAQV